VYLLVFNTFYLLISLLKVNVYIQVQYKEMSWEGYV